MRRALARSSLVKQNDAVGFGIEELTHVGLSLSIESGSDTTTAIAAFGLPEIGELKGATYYTTDVPPPGPPCRNSTGFPVGESHIGLRVHRHTKQRRKTDAGEATGHSQHGGTLRIAALFIVHSVKIADFDKACEAGSACSNMKHSLMCASDALHGMANIPELYGSKAG